MSCMCENRKRQEDMARMRSLARKAARLEGRVYVLYERDGRFGFVADGEPYNGRLVEYVWY